MKYIIIPYLFIALSSCVFKIPALEISDKYISVKKPGQSWALAEIEVVKMDSIFGYPKIEKFIKSFVIVDSKDKKVFNGNSSIKFSFNNIRKDYQWKINNDLYLQNISYEYKIEIKPDTWYKLSSQNCSYELYFYWQGKEGEYVVKEKPKSGAW